MRARPGGARCLSGASHFRRARRGRGTERSWLCGGGSRPARRGQATLNLAAGVGTAPAGRENAEGKTETSERPPPPKERSAVVSTREIPALLRHPQPPLPTLPCIVTGDAVGDDGPK
ncbi:hypothetical protein MC885_010443 [Smutsia gigantea]|nr:hypothetical protein MC885_010443 [Smutsia gigantea]